MVLVAGTKVANALLKIIGVQYFPMRPQVMKILHGGLIITYLKNFIFDDDCIACQKHGKHGDKKILIDSVLCVLVLMGFELPFTDDGRGYHHNIHFLLMSKLACVSPMFILQSTNDY